MKKLLALLLALAMVFGLVACGSSSGESTTAETGSAETSQAEGTDTGSTEKAVVSLTMWGAEEDQTMLRQMADEFIAAYADQADITITLGVESEATAKDTILTDVTAAADVYAFADDQINELVAAGALQAIPEEMGLEEIKSANVAGSVEAATVDGTLYAYPMTADNGYFMFYNSEYFTEEDVQSLDRMMEVAAEAGKQVGMTISDGWYIYSFFKGAGLELGLAEDGVNNICNWNEEPGADVCQAILDITSNPGFINVLDADLVAGMKDGSIIAGVSGTWNAAVAEECWGENYAACKLPTYTLNGEQVQMSSFSGYKLVGVNPHSANVGYAMLLAQWITNEENQNTRFEERGMGPSNLNAAASDAVQAAPAIAALAEQAAYATPQRVGANYWTPAQTLGSILVNGNPDGTDLQELIDTAVEGIVAPVT